MSTAGHIVRALGAAALGALGATGLGLHRLGDASAAHREEVRALAGEVAAGVAEMSAAQAARIDALERRVAEVEGRLRMERATAAK
jgi:hypothetical protein